MAKKPYSYKKKKTSTYSSGKKKKTYRSKK